MSAPLLFEFLVKMKFYSNPWRLKLVLIANELFCYFYVF